MPSKAKKVGRDVAKLPSIPKELVELFLTGPVTGEAINAAGIAFKTALTIPASGFFEWTGRHGRQAAPSVHCGRWLTRCWAFVDLWDNWRIPGTGETIHSTIIVSGASAWMALYFYFEFETVGSHVQLVDWESQHPSQIAV
jgi:hypothetical protein